MTIKLDKSDILDYFIKQDCTNCEFKEECERNENEFGSISLCSLFDVG